MARKYICSSPKDKCGGALLQTNNSLGKSYKMHATPQEAFNCYAKYLLSQGYKQIGNREYQEKEGGPITVLTKKSRFGAAMRPGKAGEKGQTNNRFVPYSGHYPVAGFVKT